MGSLIRAVFLLRNKIAHFRLSRFFSLSPLPISAQGFPLASELGAAYCRRDTPCLPIDIS